MEEIMKLEGLKINFLGDSITEGCGTTNMEEDRFTTLIAKNTGAICRNYGIGGTRIAPQYKPSVQPRWDGDFLKRMEEMDPDADVVVVFGGTNDFGHGDAPVGNFEDRTPATFCGALHTLCRRLLEKYPESTIVFLTPLHRRGEESIYGEEVWNPEKMVKAPLKTYVDLIRQTAEYYSLPVLDLYAVSGMQPAVEVIRDKYMPDSLHPNTEGHKILTRLITRFLENLL